jgi:hypothetical protein
MKNLFIAFCCLVGFSAFSEEQVFLNCYDCTSGQVASVAANWISQPRVIGQEYHIHVADVKNGYTKSYSATTFYLEQEEEFDRTIWPITTPTSYSSKVSSLHNSIQAYASDIEDNTVIPTDIISHPWVFINCAYCERRVETYVNSVSEQRRDTLRTQFNAYLQNWTPFGGSAKTYRVPLAAGGDIEISITVDSLNITNDFKVTLNMVVDADGNELPEKADSLDELNLFFAREDSAFMASSFLQRWNLTFDWSKNRNGVVTITDCPTTGCP